MKRKLEKITDKYERRTGDIKRDLTPSQLAAIGSVILAYTEAATEIDGLLFATTELVIAQPG